MEKQFEIEIEKRTSERAIRICFSLCLGKEETEVE